jgi:nucleotide-binding universal stress UspA family protein
LLGRKPESCTRDRGRHAFFSTNQIDRRTVRDEERNGTQRAAGRADIARHLARHNLKVDFKRIVANEDIGNTILSAAADLDSDMIVMGGYGHSRLREFAADIIVRSSNVGGKADIVHASQNVRL